MHASHAASARRNIGKRDLAERGGSGRGQSGQHEKRIAPRPAGGAVGTRAHAGRIRPHALEFRGDAQFLLAAERTEEQRTEQKTEDQHGMQQAVPG